jgi:CheY-like chemotaxis protein
MKLLKILLVEDNEYDAESAIRKLNNMGNISKVIRAGDGEEAINYLFQPGGYENLPDYSKPDLILLDIMMPKIIGTQVLKKIREDGPEEMKAIPVIMLTTIEDYFTNKECFNLGAKGFLVKPIQINHLKDFLISFELL